MAFRQTTFDPSVSAQYARAGPGVAGLPQAQSTVDMARMEEALARQLANQKQNDDRRRREIEKLCGESDELKELQAKIKAAYLNKERSQQMTEKQYRDQVDLVSLLTEFICQTSDFLTSLVTRPLGERCSNRYHYAQEQGDRRPDRA